MPTTNWQLSQRLRRASVVCAAVAYVLLLVVFPASGGFSGFGWPYMVIFAGIGAIIGAGLLHDGTAAVLKTVKRDGCCASCGYDLRGTTSDACPECGADISDILRRAVGKHPPLAPRRSAAHPPMVAGSDGSEEGNCKPGVRSRYQS